MKPYTFWFKNVNAKYNNSGYSLLVLFTENDPSVIQLSIREIFMFTTAHCNHYYHSVNCCGSDLVFVRFAFSCFRFLSEAVLFLHLLTVVASVHT